MRHRRRRSAVFTRAGTWRFSRGTGKAKVIRATPWPGCPRLIPLNPTVIKIGLEKAGKGRFHIEHWYLEHAGGLRSSRAGGY